MTLVGAYKASDNPKLVLEQFREDKLQIIHIQHFATHSTATFFRLNTEGAKIHNNLQPLGGEKVIIKLYPNSFRETELFS